VRFRHGLAGRQVQRLPEGRAQPRVRALPAAAVQALLHHTHGHLHVGRGLATGWGSAGLGAFLECIADAVDTSAAPGGSDGYFNPGGEAIGSSTEVAAAAAQSRTGLQRAGSKWTQMLESARTSARLSELERTGSHEADRLAKHGAALSRYDPQETLLAKGRLFLARRTLKLSIRSEGSCSDDCCARSAAPGRAGQVAPWSFRVLVDARCWVGQVLSTCKVDSIVEALAIRECVRAARSQGWSSLRRTLARFMPRLRRHPLLPGIAPLGLPARGAARGRKRRAAAREALPGEAWLESLDRRCLALRLRREEQRGLQRERCARRQRERCEARVQRVEGRVAGVAAQIAERLEARGRRRAPAPGDCRRPSAAAPRRPRLAERPPKRRAWPRLASPRLAPPRGGGGAGFAGPSRRLLRFGKKGGADFGGGALLMASALGA
ncbi:unnamed protein product, partial [Prorocentrum cordatum]